jgi:hypothetical protein
MTPTTKMTAVGVAGAVTILAVYVLKMLTGADPPAEVASAFTTVLTFAAGYIIKEKTP